MEKQMQDKGKNYIVGFDLGRTYAQISYVTFEEEMFITSRSACVKERMPTSGFTERRQKKPQLTIKERW